MLSSSSGIWSSSIRLTWDGPSWGQRMTPWAAGQNASTRSASPLKTLQIGHGVAQAHQPLTGEVGPQGPDAPQDDTPGDLAQTAPVERVEVGDILIHRRQLNMADLHQGPPDTGATAA